MNEPTPQEEISVLARKVEDECIQLRSDLYKLEMLLRKCEKCLEAVK